MLINYITILSWETLKTRRKNHKLTLLFKIINNLYDIIEHCLSTQHVYNLRQNNVYRIPVARTVSYYKSFFQQLLNYGMISLENISTLLRNAWRNQLLNNWKKHKWLFRNCLTFSTKKQLQQLECWSFFTLSARFFKLLMLWFWMGRSQTIFYALS